MSKGVESQYIIVFSGGALFRQEISPNKKGFDGQEIFEL